MKWFGQRRGTHPTTWTHSTHCQRSHATVDMCGCHITVKLAAQIFGCQMPFHVSHLIRNSSSFLWYAIIFWKFPQNSCESVKILLKFNRLATFIVGAYKKLWKIRKIYVDDWRWKFFADSHWSRAREAKCSRGVLTFYSPCYFEFVANQKKKKFSLTRACTTISPRNRSHSL